MIAASIPWGLPRTFFCPGVFFEKVLLPTLSPWWVYSALNHLQWPVAPKHSTSQARGNIIRAAIVCLLRQIWICKACPPQFHYILSGLNDLFHLGRIISKPTQATGVFTCFQFLRPEYIYPLLPEGGWMSAAEHIRIFVVSTGYINRHCRRSSVLRARLSPETLYRCHRISWLIKSRAYCILTASRPAGRILPGFKRSPNSSVRRFHREQEL